MQNKKGEGKTSADTKVQLLTKAQDFYVGLVLVLRKFPRPERYTLAENIDEKFMKCVDLIYQATYQSEERAEALKALRRSLHLTTFLISSAHDLELITAGNKEKSNDLYKKLVSQLDEMGRMTSSWIAKNEVKNAQQKDQKKSFTQNQMNHEKA